MREYDDGVDEEGVEVGFDCTYTRKVCAQCTETTSDDGESTIRFYLQSNGLPQNCFYATKEILEQNISFSVFWNSLITQIGDSNQNRVNIDAGDDGAFAEEVCDVANKGNGYGLGLSVELGAHDMDNVIGVSLDGVLLFPPVELADESTSTYVDPWYPDTKGSNSYDVTSFVTEDLDNCLGSISDDGEYRYRAASDCIGT